MLKIYTKYNWQHTQYDVYILGIMPYNSIEVIILIYGYHRTSTKEQHLDRGEKEIKNYCQEHKLELVKIYTDKQTGKNFDRPRYTVLKEDVLREGDTLLITEVDRLGRNKNSILNELKHFKDKNIRIMILEIPTTLMDLSQLGNELAKLMLETINNMLIDMYATFAQAEMNKRVKRQIEGIQTMKDRGEWERYGRPKIMTLGHFEKEYEKVEKGQKKPFELMRELNLTRSTFYRYKKKLEIQKNPHREEKDIF